MQTEAVNRFYKFEEPVVVIDAAAKVGDILASSHLKEMLTGSAITFILKISGMLLGYLVVIQVFRRYGSEGIGVYNLTFRTIIFAAMVASMGMNVSILRYVGQV